MQRREFLQTLSLIAMGALAAPACSLAAARFATNPFVLGVASGSPDSEGFVLWTRLIADELQARKAINVEWQLYEDGQPTNIVRSGSAVALAALGFSVHVELSALQADKWFGYCFRVAGQESRHGRVRTMPASQQLPSQFRFAYASCQRFEDGFYAAYAHMQQDQPDLVFFVGDYIYEYGSRPDSVRGQGLKRIRSLDDYRARYALYKSDPMLQGMHAQCPWVVTWDDHEVENNYFGNRSIRHDRDISKLRAIAYQAFYEHMPLRASTLIKGLEGLRQHGALRIYQHVQVGRLASFHVLDLRQYRSQPPCVGTDCDEPDHVRTLLCDQQASWLENGLAAAQNKTWNMIVQQTRFTPANYHRSRGVGFNSDTWDGYFESRDRLLAFMAKAKLRNTAVFGGDIHQNWVARAHENSYDIASSVVCNEFCGTSISSRSRTTVKGIRTAHRRNPHLIYAHAEHRGYGLVDLTPKAMEVRLYGIEQIKSPTSKRLMLAHFQQDAGSPSSLRRYDGEET